MSRFKINMIYRPLIPLKSWAVCDLDFQNTI